MSEDRYELLNHYRRMRADLLAAIEGLTAEQLSDPSLDGWSVKDHLFHLASWDEIRVAEVLRIAAGHDSAWRMHGRDGEFSALTHDLRRDLSPMQAQWELAMTGARLLEAIGAATERGLDASLYGEAALRSTHEAQHTQWIRRWRDAQGY